MKKILAYLRQYLHCLLRFHRPATEEKCRWAYPASWCSEVPPLLLSSTTTRIFCGTCNKLFWRVSQ